MFDNKIKLTFQKKTDALYFKMVNLPIRGKSFAFLPNPLMRPMISSIKIPMPKIGISIQPITGMMPNITLPATPVIRSKSD